MVQLFQLARHDVLQRRRQSGAPVPWLVGTDLQWCSALSSVVAVCGWVTWVVGSEIARRRTHDVVEGFALRLKHEPWPLWAPIPVTLVLLPLVALLLHSAQWRARVQARVAAGGVPFLDGLPPGASGGDPTPRAYFTATVGAATAAWLLHAVVVWVLVLTGVWATALAGLRTASQVVTPYSAAAHAAAHAATHTATNTNTHMDTQATVTNGELASVLASLSAELAAGRRRGLAGVAAAAVATAVSHGTGDAVDAMTQGSAWERVGWGPDFPGPGGRCPPSCVDLSVLSAYLGDDSCCCNAIGGVFAAEPHAAAGLQALIPALVGLAVLWAGLSWLLLAATSQFAHTESELLSVTAATCDAAAAAGEPGNLPAVTALAGWMERRLSRGSKGPAGRGGEAAGDPLLGSPDAL